MNFQANTKGKKIYFGLVVMLLALIIFVTSKSMGNAFWKKNFLNLSVFGSQVFRLREMFELIGGLGIFLFGIKFMGEGLQLVAGSKIRKYITKFTNNPIKGFILGLFITGLIQSSSGTTALVIALVAVGLMTFRQSMAVIIGANLGTTITAILVGLNIKEYVWVIIALGGLQYMFAFKKKTRYIAQTILGFGILFLGMKYMGSAMKPLAQETWFKDILIQMDSGQWYSSWLSMIVSFVLTVLVQSSSASIGIIQTLHGDGLLSGVAAVPMIFGANIGTTITAILASLGASLYARRAALFHTIFNIIGALIFTAALNLFLPLLLWLNNNNWSSSGLIPTTHVIFNSIMALVFLPLLPWMEKQIKKIIKRQKSDQNIEITNLDSSLINYSPSLAIQNVQLYIGDVVRLSNIYTNYTYRLFKHHNKKDFAMVKNINVAIKSCVASAIDYLDQIGTKSLTDKQQQKITHLTLITNDVLRINSLNYILDDIANDMNHNKELFCDTDYQELKILFKLTMKIGHDANLLLVKGWDEEIYAQVIKNENETDKIQVFYKANQQKRVLSKKCQNACKKYFSEIVTRIERMADHYKIIATFLAPHIENKTKFNTKLVDDLLSQED